MTVDNTTAGITIKKEFRKYGASPVGCTPICALLQACSQGSMVGASGKLTRLPARISSSGLMELTTIT